MHSTASKCKAATTTTMAAVLTQESDKWLLVLVLALSLSTQRNVDHFCFQYEIIDSAVDSDSGSETKRERTNKFAPTCSPRPPASLSEMERGERSQQQCALLACYSLALSLSALPTQLRCCLGALFGACCCCLPACWPGLASLNNVISESVTLCV